VPANASFEGRNIVIVHDTVTTGKLMRQTVETIKNHGGVIAKVICIHALFEHREKDHNDKAELDIISTNTIPHSSNVIDVHGLIAEAVLEFYLRKPVPAIHRLV